MSSLRVNFTDTISDKKPIDKRKNIDNNCLYTERKAGKDQNMKRSSPKAGTIADVAARAGVSIPTVSRVLHQRPDVAPETRERVKRILEEVGFASHQIKPPSVDGFSGIIDMLVTDLLTPYSIEIARGVEDVLERTELRMALSTTRESPQLEERWLAKALKSGTNGALLVLARNQSKDLETLRRHHIPFVVVDHRGELGHDIPSVGATNFLGGRTATEYLLSLGHRRIAVISGFSEMRCSRDRITGYRVALDDAGIPVDQVLIRPGDFQMKTGFEQTLALLDLPEPPTAIFAGCDMQAMGVYSALQERGLRIPEDVSVLGFDDVPVSSLVTPTLTTVRQPLFEMGRVATTMLLRLIAGEPLDSRRVELTTNLITRKSCAPPRRR
jgi:LacI family transcriptional regulator